MAKSVINRHFPSLVVSDLEKMSFDYGEKVAKAIRLGNETTDEENEKKFEESLKEKDWGHQPS